MPREARKLSESGFYHIMFRGINHQDIFEEEQDFDYMLATMKALKQELQFELHAYCLMPNHVHLLLREQYPGDISTIIKRLLIKYVMRFNRKYERSGALIGSRYKSKVVAVDQYFIPLIVYIHQNPLQAGIVRQIGQYKYSSYHEYMGESDIVDDSLAKGMISKYDWMNIHQHLLKPQFEVTGQIKLNEEEIRQKIGKIANGMALQKIGTLDKSERNKILRNAKTAGLSIREIERVTGISRGIVAKS